MTSKSSSNQFNVRLDQELADMFRAQMELDAIGATALFTTWIREYVRKDSEMPDVRALRRKHAGQSE